MQTWRQVSQDEIAACVRDSYGIVAARLERLALGNDAEAAVFRVKAIDRQTYFLKLQPAPPTDTCVTVPRFLNPAGIEHVVAPLPTRTAAPWGTVGSFAVLLYPYIRGQSGFVRRLTADQWSELGTTLARIHAIEVPPDIADLLPREQFVPNPRWSAVVRAVLAGEHETCRQDEPARELGAFLHERREEIRGLLDRAETLGRMLQGRTLERVLCHADIHVGNVLVDEPGRIHIVDWDQPVLAPRECDLMLVIGPAIDGFVEGSPEEAAFFEGYGETEIDPMTMAYYRYERATSDLGAFAYRVYWMPDADDEVRRADVRWAMLLFEPGRTVDMAYRSENRINETLR